MTITHKFTLPSGVECEVSELGTKHQETLTSRDKSKIHTDKMNDVIHDILVRVGSVTNPSREFVFDMLACDKKKILVEARNFSMDFEPFVFNYDYKDKDGKNQTFKYELPIDENSFPMTTVKKLEGDEWVDGNYTDYADIQRNVYTTLPRTGMDVMLTMLDGKGEQIGATYTKNTLTSSTPVIIRRPVRFEKSKDEKNIPIKINVSTLPLKDTEHMRGLMKKVEGDVDTIISFERPEDDVTGDSRMIQMDIIQTTAFFFPSGAI